MKGDTLCMETENNQENPIEQPEEQSDNQVYLTEIENLKNNTVPKDEYNKLVKERNELVGRLANQRPPVQEVIDKPEPTREEKYKKLQENSKKLVSEELTGYEYAQILIENEDLEKDLGIDPFGAGDENSKRLKEKNDATSNLLRKALKESNGDPSTFQHIMERNTVRDR